MLYQIGKLFGNAYGNIAGRRRTRPTQTAGERGAAVYGGWIETGERSPELSSPRKRAQTYSEILLNTSIVSAGVLYFVELIGAAAWTLEPRESRQGEMYAARAQAALFEDPETPWRRIMRRAAMYRFWGYAWAEWTMRKAAAGYLTFQDVAPRAQRTIEYWDIDRKSGQVVGVWQRAPTRQHYLYIERAKSLYIVDDALNDSPEGLGLFRLMAAAARRLEKYHQLEGLGYEMDMRGVTKFTAPLAELEQMVSDNTLTEEKKAAILRPVQNMQKGFVAGKVRTMLMDSSVYQNEYGTGRTSTAKRWDAEIMKAGAMGFESMHRVIDRTERQLARTMGIEGMMLGEKTGSYSLSRDKTDNFYSRISGTLEALRRQSQRDLLMKLWLVNGWPLAMMPALKVSPPRALPPDQLGAAIRDIAGGLKTVDDTKILDSSDLETASRKIVAAIEQVDQALMTGKGRGG
ncbi:MAG: hypothetical protein OXH73_13600 [Caldilineaceae bacterium]|nr:hypothetical protein [Caldilineaceae bacterium]